MAVAPIRFGVDSCSRADSGTPSLAIRAQTFFGSPSGSVGFFVEFFGRYIKPSPPCPVFDVDKDAAAEVAALATANIRRILPITQPGAARTGLAYPAGNGDGITSASSLAKLADANLIRFETTTLVSIYLDIERDQPFTSEYWRGWYDGVSRYVYKGSFKFRPGIYFNPFDTNACNIVKGLGKVTSEWSNQPQLSCSNGCKIPPAGSFRGRGCIVSGEGTADIWQYQLKSGCDQCKTGVPNVDLDWCNDINAGRGMPIIVA